MSRGGEREKQTWEIDAWERDLGERLARGKDEGQRLLKVNTLINTT